MFRSLNKLELLIELSSFQEEAISGGNSSFPKFPKISDVDFPLDGLFGFHINKTSFYERKEDSEKISKSDKDGNFSASDSKVEETDVSKLTLG